MLSLTSGAKRGGRNYECHHALGAQEKADGSGAARARGATLAVGAGAAKAESRRTSGWLWSLVLHAII